MGATLAPTRARLTPLSRARLVGGLAPRDMPWLSPRPEDQAGARKGPSGPGRPPCARRPRPGAPVSAGAMPGRIGALLRSMRRAAAGGASQAAGVAGASVSRAGRSACASRPRRGRVRRVGAPSGGLAAQVGDPRLARARRTGRRAGAKRSRRASRAPAGGAVGSLRGRPEPSQAHRTPGRPAPPAAGQRRGERWVDAD